MDLPKTIYDNPTPEMVEEATMKGLVYVPKYNNGRFSHYQLTKIVTVKPPCPHCRPRSDI